MDTPDQAELMGRLALIERIVTEGRRSTERWGWVFLLWGAGPLLAMFWAAKWPGGAWAWPVTMSVCIVVNEAAIRSRKRNTSPRTAIMAFRRCRLEMCCHYTLCTDGRCALFRRGGPSDVFCRALRVARDRAWRQQSDSPVAAAGDCGDRLWLASLAAFIVPLAIYRTSPSSLLCSVTSSSAPISLIVSGAAAMPEQPDTLPDLDPIIHGRLRLALLSLLAGVEEPILGGCAKKPARPMEIWEPISPGLKRGARRGEEEIHFREANLALSADGVWTQSPHRLHPVAESTAQRSVMKSPTTLWRDWKRRDTSRWRRNSFPGSQPRSIG